MAQEPKNSQVRQQRNNVKDNVDYKRLKHGAILYNEAEVFSLSITNPNGRSMLPCDWLIHSGLILARCHKIRFFCVFFFVVEK